MSIIERTTNLDLTQYSGSLTRFANLYSNYNSDMLKIDTYVKSLEIMTDTRINGLATDIADFEQRVSDDFTALSEEVNAFDGRITTLETCCSDVNTTLSNYGSRLNAIEAVIATVSTQNIDDLTERVNALENKVETNSIEIGTLRNDLHEAVERIEVAEGVIVEHATSITSLDHRVTALEDCCSSVRDTLTEYNTRITQNTSDIKTLEDRLTRDETNIAGNAQDITILSNQVSINTQDIQDLKDDFSELDPTSSLEVVRQVAINTTNISNLQTAVSAQASNLTSLTSRVATAESDVDALEADNVLLHQEIAAVQDWETRIDAVEQEVSDLGDDVDAVEATVATYDTTIATMQSDITTNASEISGVKTRVTTLEGQVASDESAFTALEARVSANEADLQQVHTTITADETGLANLGNRVTALETQNGSVDISAIGSSVTDAVDKVNTKAVNAGSMATQALTTANTADATATQAASDASQAIADVATLTTDVAINTGSIGTLASLDTSDKSDLVSAINEVLEQVVPCGSIVPFGGSTAPAGWFVCNGNAVSRTTYSKLFGIIGTAFGSGDGSTTFNLPDLRGEYLRGTGTNSHSGQGDGPAIGTHQDATQVQGFIVEGGTNRLVAGSGSSNLTTMRNGDGSNKTDITGSAYQQQAMTVTQTYISFNNVRPTTTAVNYIIKY